MSRPYQLTPEAREQRRQAALDRWAAMPDKNDRREALAPAHASPNIGWPTGRKKQQDRDTRGRFETTF